MKLQLQKPYSNPVKTLNHSSIDLNRLDTDPDQGFLCALYLQEYVPSL